MMSGNVCKIASILSRVVAIVITPSLSSRTACQHSQQFNNAVTPACGTDWLIVSPRGAKWMVCSVRWQNAVSCHDARWVSRLGGVDTCTVCAHKGKRNCLDIQSAGQRRQLQSSLKSSNLLLWLHQRCLFAYLSTFTFPFYAFWVALCCISRCKTESVKTEVLQKVLKHWSEAAGQKSSTSTEVKHQSADILENERLQCVRSLALYKVIKKCATMQSSYLVYVA